MTLADVEVTGKCKILAVTSDNPDIQSRLYALGLYPGVAAELLRKAPAGDPFQVRIGSTLLSIRLTEARLISVEAMT